MVLADVARLGQFFTVTTDTTDTAAPDGARPVGDVHAHPELLEPRIAHVAAVLGPDDPVVARRVAASITFQGLAALLVSAPFAAVVVHGVLPELTPRTLHWTPSADGPGTLWAADPRGRAVPEAAGAADALVESVLGEQLAPLVTAVQAQVAVSPRVLWGNVASTVAAARRMVVQRWPDSAARAAAVAHRVLGGTALAGTCDLGAALPPDRFWTFRRRSCCLYYRTGGGLCGDCVLTDRMR